MKKRIKNILGYLLLVVGLAIVAIAIYVGNGGMLGNYDDMNYKVITYSRGDYYTQNYALNKSEVMLIGWHQTNDNILVQFRNNVPYVIDINDVEKITNVVNGELVYQAPDKLEKSNKTEYEGITYFRILPIGLFLSFIIVSISLWAISNKLSIKKYFKVEHILTQYNTDGMVHENIDDVVVSKKTNGIISTRTWVLRGKGLYSVNQGTHWRYRVEYADEIPKEDNNCGIYGYRLGCVGSGNFIWSGVYSNIIENIFQRNTVCGIVAQGG